MAAPSRATQFSHMHKVLKKYFKPTSFNVERSVLEHTLFACLAENAYYPVAEEAYAAVVETYYDWNEVRVTTIRELSEVMARLPDPPAAASRMRRVLQHVFENGYVFDLEYLRKQNLGPTVEELNKIDGASSFVVSYVTQSTLGGHAIPLDAGALRVLLILDLATSEEVKKSTVSGLERAIPKNKGSEFGTLLHELAASFVENPFATALKKIMIEINPKAKDRLPKRGGGKAKQKQAEKEAEKVSKAAKEAAKKVADAEPDEEPVVKEEPAAKKVAKKAAAAKKTPAKKASKIPTPEKKTAKRKIMPTKKKVKAPAKKTTQKKAAAKPSPAKKAPAKKAEKKKAPTKKVPKKAAAKKAAPKKKSSKDITKRKPR